MISIICGYLKDYFNYLEESFKDIYTNITPQQFDMIIYSF